MPSELGKAIRKRRGELSLGLRELARQIGRSPAYIVELERSDAIPGATEETIQALSAALNIDPDILLSLAGKTPEDAAPASALDLVLYRLIRALPEHRKLELKTRLEGELGHG